MTTLMATADRTSGGSALTDADIAALKQFLVQLTPGSTHHDFQSETPLLAGGRLDSLGVLQLVGYLDETFGIAVEDDDFTEENFATVGALLAFVARKVPAG